MRSVVCTWKSFYTDCCVLFTKSSVKGKIPFFKFEIWSRTNSWYFFTKIQTHFCYILNEIYETKYVPFWSITFCNFSDKTIMPSLQSVWDFWAKHWNKWFSQASFEASFTPLRELVLQRVKKMVVRRDKVQAIWWTNQNSQLSSQFLVSH